MNDAINKIEQRTEEWHNARCGNITASRMYAVMNTLKNGESGADRRKYISELILERLTGVPVEHFQTAAMRHGVELEPLARHEYEMQTGNLVDECGFFLHSTIPHCGASPDGLIGNDGLIEIKCPESSTHIEFLRTGEIIQNYIYQIQWQMECTGRQWCDFVSFDNRMPEKMKLKIVRVKKDDELIEKMKQQIYAVNTAVDEVVSDLQNKYLEQQHD